MNGEVKGVRIAKVKGIRGMAIVIMINLFFHTKAGMKVIGDRGDRLNTDSAGEDPI